MSDKRDKKLAKASTPTSRLMRLTGMTTSIATKVAGHQVKKLFQNEQAIARDREKLMRDVGRQVASTLGEMKGAVMKVGQIASQMQDLLPEEIAEALTVLQKASAPMPFSIIRRQLKHQLGDDPANLFKTFDEVPFAAASIGQVHKATTLDGREVVVKVQYPAVKSSIDSDMRQLRRILRLGALFKVDEKTLDAIFKEIKEQLDEELDYKKEAQNIVRFREFHRNDKWLIIPEVVDELSADQVLTLIYEPGDDLDTIANNTAYSQETCNLIGEHLFDAIRRQMFELQEIHCDPHPGNFAFRPDGTLIMYDFGATKRVASEDLVSLKTLMRAAYESDYRAIDRALLQLDVRKENSPEIEDDFYQTWIELLIPPFAKEPFNFETSRLHIDLMKETRKTPWRYLESFQPSPRTLLINRIFGGHYWTLVKLGVNTSFRENVELTLHE
ncbi:MAG: AarF/ABC1/UbiB kinase family protein [Gammaproteobacteria bacterium]|jgi:predicted unusual protein kinase regulating ubiquinone biosynthesis (AarF/ABC1/UbiB family)|nr:AarF/ABC1/UbiB kinase family protein [Gammaproteobacteria bacterium]MBQ0774781.1 AarF/ABC1/UbiB kinase family protein [Gammaproteobacteria bacterium]